MTVIFGVDTNYFWRILMKIRNLVLIKDMHVFQKTSLLKLACELLAIYDIVLPEGAIITLTLEIKEKTPESV